jgi:hypothetical protein
MGDVERAYFEGVNDPNDPTYRRRTKTGKVSIVKKGLKAAKKVVIGDTLGGAAARAGGLGLAVASIALRKRIPGYGTASGFVGGQVARGRTAVEGAARQAESYVARKTPYGVVKDASAKAGKTRGVSDDVAYQQALERMASRP